MPEGSRTHHCLKMARVQKRLQDEEENAERHQAAVYRHLDLLRSQALVVQAWATHAHWRVEGLDGSLLHLSFTSVIRALIAFTHPVDIENEDDGAAGDAIARIAHLKPELAFWDRYRRCSSLPDDDGDVLDAIAREHQRSRDGAAVASCIALVDPARLIEAGRLFERARFNVERVEKLLRQREGGERERPAWLVEGLLPQGEVVMLAGEGGAGKSTLTHELAVAVATPAQDGEAAPTRRGRPIDRGRAGDVLFLTLEESEVWFGERGARLDPLGEAERAWSSSTATPRPISPAPWPSTSTSGPRPARPGWWSSTARPSSGTAASSTTPT